MKIKYRIEILSDWHIGSGLDSGSEADALVLKDENSLPFIPGKTLKGLFKNALQEISEVQPEVITREDIHRIFGGNTKGDKTIKGKAFFNNAELTDDDKKEIIANNLSSHLYRNIASTKINKNGVAEKSSLRTIEVCIPVNLEGEIIVSDEKAKTIMRKAFMWTRHIGVSRNRGLGRCRIITINE